MDWVALVAVHGSAMSTCSASDDFEERCVRPDGHSGEHLFPLETAEITAGISGKYLSISEKNSGGLHVMVNPADAARLRDWLNKALA
jgi:hypothetical protein